MFAKPSTYIYSPRQPAQGTLAAEQRSIGLEPPTSYYGCKQKDSVFERTGAFRCTVFLTQFDGKGSVVFP
jgi:hypothetical protein